MLHVIVSQKLLNVNNRAFEREKPSTLHSIVGGVMGNKGGLKQSGLEESYGSLYQYTTRNSIKYMP